GAARWQVGLTAAGLYASHVLLDMACEPSPKNPGMPVLWPLTLERFLFAWRPLPGIWHGGSQGLAVFLDKLFSTHNLGAVGVELAVFVPVLVLTVLGVRLCRATPPPSRR